MKKLKKVKVVCNYYYEDKNELLQGQNLHKWLNKGIGTDLTNWKDHRQNGIEINITNK